METLNKNWFAFTLIAVIFAGLGYFYGKQSHACCAKQKHPQCQMSKDTHHSMTIVSEKIKERKEMEIEEKAGQNGEKEIKVTVKKEGKEE